MAWQVVVLSSTNTRAYAARRTQTVHKNMTDVFIVGCYGTTCWAFFLRIPIDPRASKVPTNGKVLIDHDTAPPAARSHNLAPNSVKRAPSPVRYSTPRGANPDIVVGMSHLFRKRYQVSFPAEGYQMPAVERCFPTAQAEPDAALMRMKQSTNATRSRLDEKVSPCRTVVVVENSDGQMSHPSHLLYNGCGEYTACIQICACVRTRES